MSDENRKTYQAAVDRVNRSTDREIDEATRAIQPITGFLDKPARVGNLVFRKGVSVSTVIEAAQRLYAAEPVRESGAAKLETGLREAIAFAKDSPTSHVVGIPAGWLVKRYSNDGVLLYTELCFTKPNVRSTAKTEFEPLYLHSAPPTSHVVGVNADILKALKYVRRYLNPEDHDVSYVDDVIDKAEGRGLYADRNLRGVCQTCEGTGKEGRHSICRDCYEPVPEKMGVK